MPNHCDHGSRQYAGKRFLLLVADNDISCSLIRSGYFPGHCGTGGFLLVIQDETTGLQSVATSRYGHKAKRKVQPKSLRIKALRTLASITGNQLTLVMTYWLGYKNLAR